MLRLLLAFALPVAATACSCIASGPPCQAASQVSAVFLGTVDQLKIDRMEPDEHGSVQVNGFLGKHVFFDVKEPFLGMEGRGNRVEIRTGMGGGDCGYGFELGKSYVVYAYQQPDRILVTGICSRTSLAEDAEADLQYLRSLRAGKASTYILGVVGNGENREIHYDKALGMYVSSGIPGAKVVLAGQGQNKTVTTGDDGMFRFDSLPPGKYKVAISKENYASVDGWNVGNGEIQLRAGACAYLPEMLVVDRRIHGRVVGPTGDGVAGVQVELVPVRPPPDEEYQLPFPVNESKTDQNGYYELKNVAAGEYYLGVSLVHSPSKEIPYERTFYPGTQDQLQAITAVVDPAPKTQQYDFTVPAPQHERTVEGYVHWPDRRAAEDVNILLEDPRWPWQTNVISASTDEKGHFTIQVFDGTRYRIHAVKYESNGEMPISAEPFALNPETNVSQPLQFFLTHKGDSTRELLGKGLDRWRAGLGF